MSDPLIITDSALARLQEIKHHKGADAFIRVSISSGGCAGMQVEFLVDTKQHADDILVGTNSAYVIIDSVSLDLIQGATVDYARTMMSEKFLLANIPASSSRCGCGSSFGI